MCLSFILPCHALVLPGWESLAPELLKLVLNKEDMCGRHGGCWQGPFLFYSDGATTTPLAPAGFGPNCYSPLTGTHGLETYC